jgi:hypothetical protein
MFLPMFDIGAGIVEPATVGSRTLHLLPGQSGNGRPGARSEDCV